ncbi:MAG: isoprenylcysteine carboxylmethyltransferase family protein [Clostridia bacterium]|nr:isoprenylcysteine carboxylmethyltransferase family protein [Clostridia bacterium]
MKNFVKEGQKLPLFGIGPYLVAGIAAVTVAAVVLFSYVWKIGTVYAPWSVILRIAGAVLIVLGLAIWFIGAARSDMDANIAENRLKTDGIYAWVRNPMYSGWWLVITGIGLLWANVGVLLTIPVNWLILTITLKHTEEKWLTGLYGAEYTAYQKRVNRCVPWFPKKEGR